MSSSPDVLVPADVRHNLEQQRKDAEHQARPALERNRQAAEQQAEKKLDAEAVRAIQETEVAIRAIAANKAMEATAAIERAVGKINVLLSRNPDNALIPVNLAVEIIDTAPSDVDVIRDLAEDAAIAVEMNDLPSGRVLLHSLMSEIRVRVYNLPLATYPDALNEAARLLGETKNQEAATILLAALNTLVATDHITPIPLLLAQDAVRQAESLRDQDKNGAMKALQTAKNEVARFWELGYAVRDIDDYSSLNEEISNLEKQLKAGNDSGSTLAKIKDKLAALLKLQSDREQSHEQSHRRRELDKDTGRKVQDRVA
jgi:hypothetical protein